MKPQLRNTKVGVVLLAKGGAIRDGHKDVAALSRGYTNRGPPISNRPLDRICGMGQGAGHLQVKGTTGSKGRARYKK